MTTKALSYLRVSGKSQIGNDGFPRQRDTIHRYAKANGLEVVEEFRDEGVSGTKEMSGRVGLADYSIDWSPMVCGSCLSNEPIEWRGTS